MIKGVPVSGGIAIGAAFAAGIRKAAVPKIKIKDTEINGELTKFESAVAKVKEQIVKIKNRLGEKTQSDIIDIFEAHLTIADDPAFISGITEKIRESKVNFEYAVDLFLRDVKLTFDSIQDEYIRNRYWDIYDIARRVQEAPLRVKPGHIDNIPPGVVLVTRKLTPAQAVTLIKKNIKGIITEEGSPASHVSIICKSYGIPMITGAFRSLEIIKTGDSIIADANKGKIFINPPSKIKKEYVKLLKKINKSTDELKSYQRKHSYFTDGESVNILVNLELPDETELLKEISIDGIGLFRTEFLYLVKKRIVTEDEQFEIYKNTAERLKNKPVTIRTFDIGADKSIEGRADSENSPLGLRAVRYCLKHKEIFISQIKAVLRASPYGNLKMLIPFVSLPGEIKEVKKIIKQCAEEISGTVKAKKIPLGAMIEIPSAVFIIDDILKETDFISVGTNDMLQYLTAAERTNKDLGKYYNPYHPALFQIIKILIDKARIRNKPVYFCGEIITDPCFFLIVCGLGARNFSMNLKFIPETKKIVSKFSVKQCTEFARKIIMFNSINQIESYVKTVIYPKVKRVSPEIENFYLRYVKK